MSDTFTQNQFYLTGYSLMSQMSQGDQDKPTSHDIIALEVMGLLISCFHDDYEIKEILYEGLYRAITLNNKLVPHITDFLMPHLARYFNFVGSCFELYLEKVVDDNIEELVLRDHIGKFTQLVVHCIILSDKYNLTFGYESVLHFFDKALEKTPTTTLTTIGVDSPITERKMIMADQYLNLLEVFMTYAVWKADAVNENVRKLLDLYRHWVDCKAELNLLRNPKGVKKKKENWQSKYRKHIALWDFDTLLRFMRIYFDDSFEFVDAANRDALRAGGDLKSCIMSETSEAIAKLRSEPEYLQHRHSKRMLNLMIDLAQIMFQQMKAHCELDGGDICSNECLYVVETFKNIILTIEALFKRRCSDFYRKLLGTTENVTEVNVSEVLEVVKTLISKICATEGSFEEISGPSKVVTALLSIIDTLHDYLPAGSPQVMPLYEFIYNICVNTEFEAKSLGIVFKVLFALREKATAGADFYITIAALLTREFGAINDENAPCPFLLRAITHYTVDPCALSLFATMKTQLEQVIYLMKKSEAMHSLKKQFPCESATGEKEFFVFESP